MRISQKYIFIISSLFTSAYSHSIIFELSNYVNNKLNSIKDDEFTYHNFTNLLIDNSLYTKIKIGQPYQEIIAWINAEEYSYFLFKNICKLDSYYDETKSKTYSPNDDYKFLYNGYSQTIYINESFYFGKKEIKEFPIMFMRKPENDTNFIQRNSINDITGKTCITFGFRFIKNYYESNYKNFLSVLNDLDIINDYIVFFEYDEKGNEKFLLLGEYTDIIFKNKYAYKEGCLTNIKIYNRFKPQWGLQFDKIYSKNIKIEINDAAFHHNLGVIYAPFEYKEFIEKNYFDDLINKKICKKINENEYIFYFCDKIKLGNEIENFPEIKFIKNEFEEEFILTYKDLFFTKGNNTYFLIIFHNLYNKIWELGKPFLKKYLFAYNFDSKIMLHYNISSNIKLNKNESKEKKSFFIYIIIIAIFFGILFFIFGKKYYNKRKIRAEELETNFSYNYKINKFNLLEK